MSDGERRGLEVEWGPRALWRVCRRGTMVAGWMAVAFLEIATTRPRTRLERAQWVQRLCARVLRGLGIPVTVEGEFPRAGAAITNHHGYMDILVLASVAPCVFVSKAEVARWPVFGTMTRMAGTVFVERGRGGSAAAARERLRAAAEEGVPVVLFPEGTTSDGTGLLPFHGGMLAEARAAGMAVTAGALRYAVSGPAGATVGEDVAYWGDRGMVEHVVRFLTLENVRVWVRFAADPIAFGTDDRKRAAAEARIVVQRVMEERAR